jgi:hypothetical protein
VVDDQGAPWYRPAGGHPTENAVSDAGGRVWRNARVAALRCRGVDASKGRRTWPQGDDIDPLTGGAAHRPAPPAGSVGAMAGIPVTHSTSSGVRIAHEAGGTVCISHAASVGPGTTRGWREWVRLTDVEWRELLQYACAEAEIDTPG